MFTECLATSISARKSSQENIEALIFSIARMQNDYISRISHPEPGMPAKQYFKVLREKFAAQASELIDQINNMY
jgi:hypothetical protein